MPCRVANHVTGELDCWAHSVLLDHDAAQLTALKVGCKFNEVDEMSKILLSAFMLFCSM